jgi:hypothetical protein
MLHASIEKRLRWGRRSPDGEAPVRFSPLFDGSETLELTPACTRVEVALKVDDLMRDALALGDGKRRLGKPLATDCARFNKDCQ